MCVRVVLEHQLGSFAAQLEKDEEDLKRFNMVYKYTCACMCMHVHEETETCTRERERERCDTHKHTHTGSPLDVCFETSYLLFCLSRARPRPKDCPLTCTHLMGMRVTMLTCREMLHQSRLTSREEVTLWDSHSLASYHLKIGYVKEGDLCCCRIVVPVAVANCCSCCNITGKFSWFGFA